MLKHLFFISIHQTLSNDQIIALNRPLNISFSKSQDLYEREAVKVAVKIELVLYILISLHLCENFVERKSSLSSAHETV